MSIPTFAVLTASTGMLELVLELTDANKKVKEIKALRGEIISELAYRDVVASMVEENMRNFVNV